MSVGVGRSLSLRSTEWVADQELVWSPLSSGVLLLFARLLARTSSCSSFQWVAWLLDATEEIKMAWPAVSAAAAA